MKLRRRRRPAEPSPVVSTPAPSREDGLEVVDVRTLNGPPTHGLAARVRAVTWLGDPARRFHGDGYTLACALRKLARVVEEERAVGDLEKTHPLRLTRTALEAVLAWIWRNTDGRVEPERPPPEIRGIVYDALMRVRAELADEIRDGFEPPAR